MIFGIHICLVKMMCHVQEWLLNPCYSFELSPLNELYSEKLVNSIIVNIPYLLALTFSIISSNIYISFTLRLGGLPSLLMAIFTPAAYIQVDSRLDFVMEAKNMNPDQTKQSDLGPYHFLRI